jgi:F0F1-type ATP synthase membrane subunit c/vacuolar-type H+-ATPase subunit K
MKPHPPGRGDLLIVTGIVAATVFLGLICAAILEYLARRGVTP